MKTTNLYSIVSRSLFVLQIDSCQGEKGLDATSLVSLLLTLLSSLKVVGRRLVLSTFQKFLFRVGLVLLLLQALDGFLYLPARLPRLLGVWVGLFDFLAHSEQVTSDQLHIFLCQTRVFVRKVSIGTLIFGDLGQPKARLLVIELEALGCEIDGTATV